MIDIIEEKKVYYPETIEEEPLPETITWESISNRPRSLAELDSATMASIDAAILAIDNELLTLGDLAFLDQITETVIADNAITSPKIAAGSIVAGKIAAGAIDGITITGSLIRTSATGARVEIKDSTDRISIYDTAGEERMRLDQEELAFYDAAGDLTGTIGALYSNILAINIPTGELGLVVYYNEVSKFAVGLSGSVFYDDVDYQNSDLLNVGNIEANDNTSDIGTELVPFDNLHIRDIYLSPQSANPTTDGQIRYYQNGGTHEIRVQLNGTDYRFVLETP